MRIIGYVRASIDVPLDRIATLDEQRAILTKTAAARGDTLIASFADEGRAAGPNLSTRAGLADALGALRDLEAGALIVPTLERLTPDLIEQELLYAELERRGTPLLIAARADQRLLDSPDTERDLIRRTIAGTTRFAGTLRELNVLQRVRSTADDPEGATLSWIERLSEHGSTAREINAAIAKSRRVRMRLGRAR